MGLDRLFNAEDFLYKIGDKRAVLKHQFHLIGMLQQQQHAGRYRVGCRLVSRHQKLQDDAIKFSIIQRAAIFKTGTNEV